MARRREAFDELRVELIVRYRGLIGSYPSLSEFAGCPWPAKLAALEAGEPVTLAGWEVGWHHVPLVRLEADGTVVAVRVG